MIKYAIHLLMLLLLTSCQANEIKADDEQIKGIAIFDEYYPSDFPFDDLKETLKFSVVSPDRYHNRNIYVHFPSLPEDSPLRTPRAKYEYQIHSEYFIPSDEILAWKTISYDLIKLKKVMPSAASIELIYKGLKEFSPGEKATIHALLRNNTKQDVYVCNIYGLQAYLEEKRIIIEKTADREKSIIMGGQPTQGGFRRITHAMTYDKSTNSFVCKQSESELPEKEDFTLIKSGDSIQCQYDFEVPSRYPLGKTKIIMEYISSFDGRNIGIKAITEIPETELDVNIIQKSNKADVSNPPPPSP